MSQVKLFALGGLDEDGKNMYIVEIDDEIYVIECGLKYPESSEQLGIEMIIPDFKYLEANANRIKGIFISHGHDDVMAALPSLLKTVKAPVYTTPLTATLLERRFSQEKLKNVELHRIQRNANFKIGNREIVTFGVTESMADGFGVAIGTDDGYVVYTSEFIIDYDITNAAFKCDISNLTKLANKGVLCLLSESVGSSKEGHSAPHHRLTPLIEKYFEEAPSRICITIYDQNLYRLIEVVELAQKFGRKILFYDEELRTLMRSVSDLGYYHIPAGLEILKDNFNNNIDNVLVIISGNGSNIFKRVHKIATKEDQILEFKASDTILICSPAVPGTEKEATRMENDLYKEGAKVVAIDAKRMFSMHAAIEDLKMMVYLLKPKYYMPIKGEYRQLISNANIALSMGYNAKDIIVMDNGQICTINNGNIQQGYGHIDLEDVLIDGKENLDASGMVLKDREILSTDGVIIVGVVINHANKQIIGGPDVQSRGVIYLKDADYIVKEIGKIIEKSIADAVKNKTYDNMNCRADARDKISKYVFKETGKRPMILPAIVEINTTE